MIVISGALVLVAAVLLVLGIVVSSQDLTLVYIAIGLSIVSAIFLLAGLFQRPPLETAPAEGPHTGRGRRGRGGREDEHDGPDAHEADRDEAGGRAERAAAGSAGSGPRSGEGRQPERRFETEDQLAGGSRPEDEAALAAYERSEQGGQADQAGDESWDELADEPEAARDDPAVVEQAVATGADVFVINGRPRYHVRRCQWLADHPDSEPLEIGEARELGFTPCAVCDPDRQLADQPFRRPDGGAPAAGAAQVGAQRAESTAEQPTEQAPTKEQPTVQVASPSEAGQAREPRAAEPASAGSSSTAAAAGGAAGTSAAAPSGSPRTVVVVDGRNDYHRSDCSLVGRGQGHELSKVAAIRQGYFACGTCKP